MIIKQTEFDLPVQTVMGKVVALTTASGIGELAVKIILEDVNGKTRAVMGAGTEEFVLKYGRELTDDERKAYL